MLFAAYRCHRKKGGPGLPFLHFSIIIHNILPSGQSLFFFLLMI